MSAYSQKRTLKHFVLGSEPGKIVDDLPPYWSLLKTSSRQRTMSRLRRIMLCRRGFCSPDDRLATRLRIGDMHGVQSVEHLVKLVELSLELWPIEIGVGGL